MIPWGTGKMKLNKRYFLNEITSNSLSDSMFSSTNIFSTHYVSGEFVARGGQQKWCLSFLICHIKDDGTPSSKSTGITTNC